MRVGTKKLRGVSSFGIQLTANKVVGIQRGDCASRTNLCGSKQRVTLCAQRNITFICTLLRVSIATHCNGNKQASRAQDRDDRGVRTISGSISSVSFHGAWGIVPWDIQRRGRGPTVVCHPQGRLVWQERRVSSLKHGGLSRLDNMSVLFATNRMPLMS